MDDLVKPEWVGQTLFAWTALAFVAACVFTAVARAVAPKLGLIDKPDGQRKLHSNATPVLGGVATFLAFALTLVGFRALFPQILVSEDPAPSYLVPFLISGGLICLLGLCDDKFRLRPRTKFAGQLLASLPYIFFGPQVDGLVLCGVHVPLSFVGPVFTLFWFAACTNVINLVDGLDGLASSIGLSASLAVAGMAAITGHVEITVTALFFAAALGGFLVHNWPPARIFLGDAGSLMIGFVLGAMTLEANFKRTAFAFSLPIVVISLPAFDTFMAIMRRKLTGRGIGDADRGHIHHRLQDHGLSRQQTLLAILAISVTMSVGSVASVYFQNEWIGMGTCAGVLATLIVGRVFGYDETALFLKHVDAVRSVFAESLRILRSRFILVRNQVTSFKKTQSLWNHLCDRAQEMGAARVTLQFIPDQHEVAAHGREWRPDTDRAALSCQWTFQYSVRNDAIGSASIEISGYGPQDARSPRFEDLFRWSDAVCREFVYEMAALQPATAESDAPNGADDSDAPALLPFAPRAAAREIAKDKDGRRAA